MAKDLKTRIMESLENLVTLEIVTAVGQVHPELSDSAEDAGKRPLEIDYSKNPKMILTRINLLQGDVTTIYHEEFVTGEYQALREFHAAREKEGHHIVMQNIEVLERLLKLINQHVEE